MSNVKIIDLHNELNYHYSQLKNEQEYFQKIKDTPKAPGCLNRMSNIQDKISSLECLIEKFGSIPVKDCCEFNDNFLEVL